MYTCKNCKGTEFRADVHQSVDVSIDESGFVTEVGFDFSEPDADKHRVWCAECGESVKPEG